MLNWKDRLRAAGIHLGISVGIAALAALLVFGIWYPYPYREISGGRELFFILVTVDVLLGPLITFSIFNRAKPMKELKRDLAIVGVIQLAALGYGLWTVFEARPVHLVFEINRFRVVHAIDVPVDLMDKSPPGLRTMPLTGPTLLSVRPFKDAAEKADATLADVAGIPIATRPDLWQAYEAARADVLGVSRPIAQLKARYPERAADIDAAVAATGRPADKLAFVPMIGRKTFWTVLIDTSTAKPVAFLPLDVM